MQPHNEEDDPCEGLNYLLGMIRVTFKIRLFDVNRKIQ